MKTTKLHVSESIISDIALDYTNSFPGLWSKETDILSLAKNTMNCERIAEQLEVLQDKISPLSKGARFLEIGSGYGLLIACLRVDYHINSFGLEPSNAQFCGTVSISKRLLSENDIDPNVIVEGIGEDIPFPDNHFDYVYSTNVLEHVNDPDQVIREAVRVTRPGGFIQIVFPNYGSFFDGHYGIFWLPHLPKKLGEIYVRLLGRNPEMMQSLQLLNYKDIMRFISDLGDKVNVLGTGQNLCIRRMRRVDLKAWALLAKLYRLLSLVQKSGTLELIIRMGSKFNWETPFVLTMRKQ